MINVRLEHVYSTISQDDIASNLQSLKRCHTLLERGEGKGSEFTGWLTLHRRMRSDLHALKTTAKRLADQSDVVLVIGIGGSYLGAKAALEALRPYFSRKGPEIIFVGHHLSGEYMEDLRDYLEDKSFSINVISKSGTTTEPAVAFRTFKTLLEKRYGTKEAAKRIVATTDKEKGALRALSDAKGYETFEVPDDVGGRYSVLSAVGLLPLAIAGIDVDAMLQGAEEAAKRYKEQSMQNPVYQYVLARHALYEKGKKIEMFIHYEPKLHYLAEWWKQLFGESEGKGGKGLFVANAGFTTDLHSLGQYIQDGERHLFETVVNIQKPTREHEVDIDEDDLDGLNYLSGRTFADINQKAMEATLLAHEDGGAPNIVIDVEKLDAYAMGHLFYFYELSCALSGYLLGVNPFDQPGVEAYKKNMFALLERPGFEKLGNRLKERIKKKTR